MPSRTIRPTQAPVDAPFVYTVSAADGFTPEAMFVSWDGSSAFGDFLPCVSYYNSEGVLLDRAFPDTGAVTAGDTAEVGYRPFKRGGGGGSVAVPLTTDNGGPGVTPTTEITFDGSLAFTNLGGGHVRVRGAAPPTIPTQWVRHAVFTGSFNPVVGFNQQILWDTIQDTFYTPEAPWATLPPGGSNGAGITSVGQYLVIASAITDPVANRNNIAWSLNLNGFTPSFAAGTTTGVTYIDNNPGVTWYTQAHMIALATLPVAPGGIELIVAANDTGGLLSQAGLGYPGAQLSVVKLSP